VPKSIALLPNHSFCPLSPTLSPAHTFLSHSPPPCHQTTPPSYTLTTYLPAYCTNCTQTQSPAVPDTSSLHYNRNTPKHIQGPQKPSSPHIASTTHLTPPPAFPCSATLSNFPNLYS
jgi:hypothetical protein